MTDLESSTYAVCLQHCSLSYGFAFARTKVDILKGVNISVTAGSIYGLLGPSGCGKTTLLKCVIGKLSPQKGLVTVFGTIPGSANSNIPGSGVGYMPQEIALLKTLTVVEVLNYHGRLHQMKPKKINARTKFLLDFLNLKEGSKLVEDLSGGQQRRVSFAAALLHEPPLLILDEPTVGVDPVLRESIWEHLLDICSNGNVTVIITTHYIEEARQANKIGLMRTGRILAEEQVDVLLLTYNLTTIEDVYLKLCRDDETLNDIEITTDTGLLQNSQPLLEIKRMNSHPEVTIIPSQKPNWKDYFKPPSSARISALIILNLLRLWRSKLLLVFILLTPVIQMSAFCMAIGGEPQNIPVATVNHDDDLGLKFIEQLNTKTIHLLPIADIDDATNLVLHGKAVATINIMQNFTPSLLHRFLSRRTITDAIIDAGSIHFRFDTIDQQLLYYLQMAFHDGLIQFAEKELVNESFPHIISNLFEIGEPVYGSKELAFTEYMITGLLINIVFFLAVGLTAIVFVGDKHDGIHDRNIIEGVTSIEVFLGHVLSQAIVVIFQTVTVLLLVLEGFQLHNRGNMIWVFSLIFLQGLCGVMYGFLISAICDDETSAMLLALGSFYPCVLLSGSLWPLEAAATIVQKFCQFVPQTIAVDSLRWIMLRGRDITWKPVWLGYVTTVVWLLVFVLLSMVVMRLKR